MSKTPTAKKHHVIKAWMWKNQRIQDVFRWGIPRPRGLPYLHCFLSVYRRIHPKMETDVKRIIITITEE